MTTMERETIKILARAVKDQVIFLALATGTVHVPVGQVLEMIFWCWDTPHSQETFTSHARKLEYDGLADWSAGQNYIGLNTRDQIGNRTPTKAEIAAWLIQMLAAMPAVSAA